MINKLSKLLLVSVLVSSPAMAVTNFLGDFIPANWTISILNSDGSVNTGGAPSSIALNSGVGNFDGSTNFTIVAPSNGTVSFDWQFVSADFSAIYDPFGYTNNGPFTQLTDNGGPLTQNGSISFAVLAGQEFGFRQIADESFLTTTTVSNFDFAPEDVPFGVDSTTGLALLGAAASWKLRRRRKA